MPKGANRSTMFLKKLRRWCVREHRFFEMLMFTHTAIFIIIYNYLDIIIKDFYKTLWHDGSLWHWNLDAESKIEAGRISRWDRNLEHPRFLLILRVVYSGTPVLGLETYVSFWYAFLWMDCYISTRKLGLWYWYTCSVVMLGHVGLMLGLGWALLNLSWVVWNRWGAIFLGTFLRAKKYVIFSAKKLGLERPLLGSCRAFIGPYWYLGPELSLIGGWFL